MGAHAEGRDDTCARRGEIRSWISPPNKNGQSHKASGQYQRKNGGLSKELGSTQRPQSIVSCSAGYSTKQGDSKPGVLGSPT